MEYKTKKDLESFIDTFVKGIEDNKLNIEKVRIHNKNPYFKIQALNKDNNANVHYEFIIQNKQLWFWLHFEDNTKYIQKYNTDKAIKDIVNNEDNNLIFEKWSLKENSIKYNKPITSVEDGINIFKKFQNLFQEHLKRIYNSFNNKGCQMKTKNIILYGPPGVGKTYNYKKIISLIESGKSDIEIFNAISTNSENDTSFYEKIKNENRVKFITFHQSYSYEDFIEGIRVNGENGNLRVEDGVFKEFCNSAKENLENSKKSEEDIKNDFSLDKLLNDFKDYVQEKIYNKEEVIITGKVTIEEVGDTSFGIGGSVKSTQRATYNIIKRDYLEYKKNNIKSYKDVKPSFESSREWHGNARYYFAIYQAIEIFEKAYFNNTSTSTPKKTPLKNYYLIIDEINRGNISKIFGELITLIEDDKRFDNNNYIEVTLPYSKETFVVPSNLYIIATMNSTDKSIALIDIALRRRFTFIKMSPNPNVLSNEKAKVFMTNLNEKIENENFKIGHGYFIDVNSDEELKFVKEYKIKPLIEEYYYGDDEKLNEMIKFIDKGE